MRKPLHDSKQFDACHRNEEDWTWLGKVGFSSLNWPRFSSVSQWKIEVREFFSSLGIKRVNSNIAVSRENENFSGLPVVAALEWRGTILSDLLVQEVINRFQRMTSFGDLCRCMRDFPNSM